MEVSGNTLQFERNFYKRNGQCSGWKLVLVYSFPVIACEFSSHLVDSIQNSYTISTEKHSSFTLFPFNDHSAIYAVHSLT